MRLTSLIRTAATLLVLGSAIVHGATSNPADGTLVLAGLYPMTPPQKDHTGRTISNLAFANRPLYLGVNGKDYLTINTNGTVNVANALYTNANGTVSVKTTLYAKEIRVQANPFPDYVFADDYRLMPLPELEAAIKRDRHLPGVPAAAEIEKDGLPVSQIVVKQMEKIEELTLHAIALNKSNLALQAELQRANERLAAIEARLAQQDGR